MSQGIQVPRGNVLLMVGTRKGAFILHSSPDRRDWRLSGPHCPGSDIFHLIYDDREGNGTGGTLFAAANHMIWGPQVEISRDLGHTWEQPREQPRFSGHAGPDGVPGSGQSVNRLWHIEPGRDAEPGVLFAGVEPAALFKSKDGGMSWVELSGLSAHPTREHWQPGLGGLCLHSIVPDCQSSDGMWVGISAAGVFRTDDAGANWHPTNKGVRADFSPNPLPEWGQCPHKVLAHPAQPGLLCQQNHCGVFRSDNGGAEWQDITEGLPSRFGFALGLHPHDPETLFVLPEDEVLGTDVGCGQRYVTDAKFRIFRSRNGGQDWEPLTQGLPQKNAYLHILREGMATDSLDPTGVYVGTTNGQIFYSRDCGESWKLLIEHLPPVNSVEVALVA